MDNTNTVPSTNISLNYNAAVGRLMPIEALNQRKKWMEDNNWNDITPGRELPSDIKYMVVDVETHDWRLNSGYKNGRIVEIAWMVFNHGMKCLEPIPADLESGDIKNDLESGDIKKCPVCFYPIRDRVEMNCRGSFLCNICFHNVQSYRKIEQLSTDVVVHKHKVGCISREHKKELKTKMR